MGPAAESRDEKRADIEIDQDLRFLRRDWRAQRVGWAVMLAIIALALGGGFGRGVLASHDVSAQDVNVRFDRIARHEARALLEVEVPAHAQEDGIATVWMDEALLERIRVDSVVPEPVRVRIEDDKIAYDVVVGADGGLVRFDVKPEEIGRARGQLGVGTAGGDGDGVEIDMLVLP